MVLCNPIFLLYDYEQNTHDKHYNIQYMLTDILIVKPEIVLHLSQINGKLASICYEFVKFICVFRVG